MAPATRKALIAVDLHGTLQGKDGQPEPNALESMQELKDDGHEIGIFTCGDTDEAKEWLDEHGFPYDYVNEDIPTRDSNKPDADLIVDNSAIRYEGDWNRTLAEAYSSGRLDKGLVRIKHFSDALTGLRQQRTAEMVFHKNETEIEDDGQGLIEQDSSEKQSDDVIDGAEEQSDAADAPVSTANNADTVPDLESVDKAVTAPHIPGPSQSQTAWTTKDAGNWVAKKWEQLERYCDRDTALLILLDLPPEPLPDNLAEVLAYAETKRQTDGWRCDKTVPKLLDVTPTLVPAPVPTITPEVTVHLSMDTIAHTMSEQMGKMLRHMTKSLRKSLQPEVHYVDSTQALRAVERALTSLVVKLNMPTPAVHISPAVNVINVPEQKSGVTRVVRNADGEIEQLYKEYEDGVR